MLVFIFLVMSLLWDSGMTKIIFNSYSIDSLGLIQEAPTNLVLSLHESKVCCQDISIQHTLNEDNLCADYLAKLVAEGNECF
jgi:hypothetical protein